MKKGKLLLHPIPRNRIIDINNISQTLVNNGFIGDIIDNKHLVFKTGKNFLQLLTFMGCSPHVRFEPVSPDDDDYCYIRLLSYDSPRLFHSDNSRTPACSYCRKPVAADWQVMENPAAGKLTCQHCMREQPLSELRWKQDAGMAAFFIEVNSIYPGEAQPVDSFMRQLEQATGSEWRFFYLLTSK